MPCPHHGGCPFFLTYFSLQNITVVAQFFPCISLLQMPSADCLTLLFYPAKKAFRLIGIVLVFNFFLGGTQRFCNAVAMLHGVV